MVLLGLVAKHDPYKDTFNVKNVFFWWGKKNHKIFAKDLAGNADGKNIFLKCDINLEITKFMRSRRACLPASRSGC